MTLILVSRDGDMIHREPNALRNHEIEPRDRLAAGWEQVGPGGIPTQDERYLRRFQELLAEYEEVQEKMEQIQCCLHYPGRGFKKEAIRIVSIDMPDWKALREQVAGTPQAQSLARALSQDLPIVISQDELNVLKHECDSLAHQMGVDFYLHSGLLTFSLFVGQSLEQREAGARLEHWPGAYFENQTLILPGTDILQDLVEINEALERKSTGQSLPAGAEDGTAEG